MHLNVALMTILAILGVQVMTEMQISREMLIAQATTAIEMETEEVVAGQRVKTTSAEILVHSFQREEREQILRELERIIKEKSEAFPPDVERAIERSMGETESKPHPVLQSPLSDIELLAEAESGVDVDLSLGGRIISPTPLEHAQEFVDARDGYIGRNGLELFLDTDNDGVSDYDEVHIYGTDAADAHTAGSALTDGERILLGFDVHATSGMRLLIESPYVAGELTLSMFQVQNIEIVKQPQRLDEITRTAINRESVVFSGLALANSFVTLYIFPGDLIIGVKADGNGTWSYELDADFQDGIYELYVAAVDGGGRILAKSLAVPFVKREGFIEFDPLVSEVVQEVSPLYQVRDNLMYIFAALLVVLTLTAFFMLSARKETIQGGTH